MRADAERGGARPECGRERGAARACARATGSAVANWGDPRRSWKIASRRGLSSSRSRTGRYGAYGQLHVWPSLASLAGAPTDAPASEVEAPVRACARYRFGADTPWFHRVVWELGVLAVSPDLRGLAVLAATTTD
nr:hypothetical protein KPHV_68400 [Kitasatospora purpeofusca]